MAWWSRRKVDGQAMLSQVVSELRFFAEALNWLPQFMQYCSERGTPVTSEQLYALASNTWTTLQEDSQRAARIAGNFMESARRNAIDGRGLHDYDVILLNAAANSLLVGCGVVRELRGENDPVAALIAVYHPDRPCDYPSQRRQNVTDIVFADRYINRAYSLRKFDGERYEYPEHIRREIEEQTPSVIVKDIASFREKYRL